MKRIVSSGRSGLLSACILFVLAGTLKAASVEQGITLLSNNDVVYLGDSVIVEVESVGLVEPLDVGALYRDADLLRETIGTRIAVMEGGVVEVKLRRMEFLPRREGPAFFGPIPGITAQGEVTSNAIVIDVQPPVDTHWQPDDDDLQVSLQWRLINSRPSQSVTADNTVSPYVGQHIIADIILKHRHPITEESLTLPSFKGFDVLSQFEQRRTLDESDKDGRWRIITWRYHLFAQRSGEIEIEGVQWQGTAVRSRTQRASFERTTSPQKMQIKAAASTANWWLPATRVSLQDEWSKDPRKLSAGDEIIRTITLTATDVLASHLPEVAPLESRAISSTLINQKRDQQLTGDTLIATASFEFRMVAQSPIPVFLDTVRVAWHDTGQDAPSEAIIPARRINVGLPERADLLADIALTENWQDKLVLRLRRVQALFPFGGISLILLSSIAGILWFQELNYHYNAGKNNRSGQKSNVLPDL